MKPERRQRLVQVAKRYYLDDWKQSEIAAELGVSRPLISRMLTAAKRLGIVEIKIHDPEEKSRQLMTALKKNYRLYGGMLVPDEASEHETNERLAAGAFSFLETMQLGSVGIGWGTFIGGMAAALEKKPNGTLTAKQILPLIGNAPLSIRNYHTNETVRLLAKGLHAEPSFLYLPAFPESVEEKEILCSTELYRQMEADWGRMDTALVNIGNYPATPDFASGARYGTALQEHGACGRMLAYFYNEEGDIIHSEMDFAIQIPISLLKNCPRVIGLCSANTSAKALRGALRTGIFTHIIAREALAEECLKG